MIVEAFLTFYGWILAIAAAVVVLNFVVFCVVAFCISLWDVTDRKGEDRDEQMD